MSDFAEAVLTFVEEIPPGRVVTYGFIADHLGRGSAIGVGGVMAREGHDTPWWRVVKANGALPPHLMLEAQERWLAEGTPVHNGRVDIRAALWAVDD